MKTIFFSLLFIFYCHISYTQTITSEWFYSIGDVTQFISVNNAEEFEPPSSGVNQIWDFDSAILSQDTISHNYVEPNTLSTYENFPTADVGLRLDFKGMQEVFYRVNNDTLEFVGVSNFETYGLTQLLFDEGQEDFVATNPMVFGETISKEVSGDVTLDGDFIAKSNYEISISFNGIGTAILPDTILENCILLTRSFIQFGEETSRVSTIYHNSLVNLVVQYQNNFDENVTIETFLDIGNINNLLTSVSPIEALKADIFNDLQDNVIIDLDASIDASIQVVSIDGRIAKNYQKMLANGRNKLRFKDELIPGIYVLIISDKKSGQFKSHQFRIL